MWRKLLLGMLGISLVFEVAFAVAGLVAPQFMLEQSGITTTDDTLFLGFALSWTVIFIALVCAFLLRQVQKNVNCHTLIYILGFWWMAVGAAVFLKFGRIDSLFMDSLRGLLIVVFNYQYLNTRRKS